MLAFALLGEEVTHVFRVSFMAALCSRASVCKHFQAALLSTTPVASTLCRSGLDHLSSALHQH